MVVYETDGLEMGIDGRGADEGKAPGLEVGAHVVRELGRSGNVLDAARGAYHGGTINKTPEVGVEAPEFLLHGEEGLGVGDRRLDLSAIADDGGIGAEALDPRRRKARHLRGVESGKGLSIGLSPPEDRDPGQAGLLGFKEEELEMPPLVMDWPAPFPVVVVQIERIVATPRTALHTTKVSTRGVGRQEASQTQV